MDSLKAYVGQTRAAKLGATLDRHGIGECTVREEFPPRRTPWFLDNGAYRDWQKQRPFRVESWQDVLARAQSASSAPDFVVVPDIVAAGQRSLGFSLAHLADCQRSLPGVAAFLAVQDGMTRHDVLQVLADFDGIFVGGTLAWKLHTAPTWVTMAHEFGKPCHIGRVGTAKRVSWAQSISADSIDSCLPLWSYDNLRAFLSALHQEPLTWTQRERDADLEVDALALEGRR